jgi:glycosyltransferase involved in cell wall biosynthesis
MSSPASDSIRVAHLITGLEQGGAEMMLWRLCRFMDPQRFRNSVISLTTEGALGPRLRAAGTTVTAIGMQRGVPSPAALRHVVGVLRQQSPDVLQTWLPHADLVGTAAGALARVPAVVWNVRYAELDAKDHPRSLRWTLALLARLSRRPAAVVVNSSAGQAAAARRGYHPRRWALIPNGFDVDRLKPSDEARASVRAELGLPADARLVGLIARYHPMKDHRMFFDAAAVLLRSHADVRFVLAGLGVDGANAALASQIQALGIGESVRLLGERTDVIRVTAALDVATCSSYSEGFPNAVGEAMACGVPCVTTDVGDCATLVGDTGVVVPPRDAAALAAGWARLLALADGERRALGLAARARIAERFSVTGVARQYEALYEEVTCRR